MNRSCVWLCTLTAATAATLSDARAFNFHGSGGVRLSHVVAGPELRAPGPVGKSAPPAQNYSFSGNSFNLSVTKNRKPPAAPPPATAPNEPERPGFFGRLFNWW